MEMELEAAPRPSHQERAATYDAIRAGVRARDGDGHFTHAEQLRMDALLGALDNRILALHDALRDALTHFMFEPMGDGGDDDDVITRVLDHLACDDLTTLARNDPAAAAPLVREALYQLLVHVDFRHPLTDAPRRQATLAADAEPDEVARATSSRWLRCVELEEMRFARLPAESPLRRAGFWADAYARCSRAARLAAIAAMQALYAQGPTRLTVHWLLSPSPSAGAFQPLSPEEIFLPRLDEPGERRSVCRLLPVTCAAGASGPTRESMAHALRPWATAENTTMTCIDRWGAVVEAGRGAGLLARARLVTAPPLLPGARDAWFAPGLCAHFCNVFTEAEPPVPGRTYVFTVQTAVGDDGGGDDAGAALEQCETTLLLGGDRLAGWVAESRRTGQPIVQFERLRCASVRLTGRGVVGGLRGMAVRVQGGDVVVLWVLDWLDADAINGHLYMRALLSDRAEAQPYRVARDAIEHSVPVATRYAPHALCNAQLLRAVGDDDLLAAFAAWSHAYRADAPPRFGFAVAPSVAVAQRVREPRGVDDDAEGPGGHVRYAAAAAGVRFTCAVCPDDTAHVGDAGVSLCARHATVARAPPTARCPEQ